MNEIDIEVKWSYPKAFEKIIETEIAQSGWGIYYISRKFGENETLLYIGITYAQNFKARLDSHSWNWFKNYRGKKLIRFGEFTNKIDVSNETIVDIESALIFEISPKHNTSKKSSYKFNSLYRIKNTGYRGEVPKLVSMKEQLECNPSLVKAKLRKEIITDSDMIKEIEEEIHPLFKDLFD